MMRNFGTRTLVVRLALSTLACTIVCQDAAAARDKDAEARKWRVPVVMEKATVRGKVVILETRTEERKAVAKLAVQVWTRVEDNRGRADRGKLLVETKTDDAGFFDLPVIEVGDYMLVVGDLQLKLTVVPEAPARSGQQQEAKVLLLLLPKEVLKSQP